MNPLSVLAALTAALVGPLTLPGDVSPALVAIIVVLLLLVFGLFLFVRRILLSFTEGLRRGRQK